MCGKIWRFLRTTWNHKNSLFFFFFLILQSEQHVLLYTRWHSTATWFHWVMPFTGTGGSGRSVTACYLNSASSDRKRNNTIELQKRLEWKQQMPYSPIHSFAVFTKPDLFISSWVPEQIFGHLGNFCAELDGKIDANLKGQLARSNAHHKFVYFNLFVSKNMMWYR